MYPLQAFKRTCFLFCLLLASGWSPIALAKIYKCTTPVGKTVYSEKPCTANHISAIITPELPPPNTGDTASTTTYSSPDVDIYITSWCPYCKQAMAYLDSQGIFYNKYDIEYDADAAARKRKLAPGYSGVPLTVINGQIISGFSENRFEQALKQ